MNRINMSDLNTKDNNYHQNDNSESNYAESSQCNLPMQNMSYSMHIDTEQMRLHNKIRSNNLDQLSSKENILLHHESSVGNSEYNDEQYESMANASDNLMEFTFDTSDNMFHRNIDVNEDYENKKISYDDYLESQNDSDSPSFALKNEGTTNSLLDFNSDECSLECDPKLDVNVDSANFSLENEDDTSSFDVEEITNTTVNDQISHVVHISPSNSIDVFTSSISNIENKPTNYCHSINNSHSGSESSSDVMDHTKKSVKSYINNSDDVFIDTYDSELFGTTESMIAHTIFYENPEYDTNKNEYYNTRAISNSSNIISKPSGLIKPVAKIESVTTSGMNMISSLFSQHPTQISNNKSDTDLTVDDLIDISEIDSIKISQTQKPISDSTSKLKPSMTSNNIRHKTLDHCESSHATLARGFTDSEKIDVTMVNKKTIDELKKLNIETRMISKWVEDESVAKCFGCGTEFSVLLRRHHCRLCGRVFCYYCSNYFTTLPLDILNKIPDRPPSFIDVLWGDDLNGCVRVCGTCFSHASKLIRIRKIIKVFELCQFTMRDLVFLSKMSPDWEDACKFLLSRFREIQYKLSIEELTSSEKQLLWINRNFLTGHSRWMVQLVKATDLTNPKAVLILDQLMYKPKRNDCWNIMCTRFCSETVGITDMLDLIRYNNNNYVISNFVRKCLNDISHEILINYLPFLVFNIKNNDFILKILLDKGIDNFKFMSHLYWCIKVYCNDTDNRKEYIVRTLITIRDNSTREFKHKFKEMINMEKLDIKWLHILNEKDRIVLPLCHDKTFVSVDDKNVRIMSSYSQPAIINFIDNKGIKKPIMFKNDDVRKDYIINNIISIIHDILKREEEDLDIEMVRYEVMPTSSNTGYIEIVENASTIFNIIENSGLTIQNYILNHNKTQIIATFREKFIRSTALYCVVSYLLGIGDRHLDNIMISQDGLLFHIDFGFILGQDPKYSNNRLIRVTPEIINVIGGYGTDDYDYFKQTCVKIYNRLRLHVNLFSNLLSIIPSIDSNITKETIKRELTERFEIGENCLEAATHMDTKVDSKNNFEYMLIDFLYKSKKSNIYKGISYVAETVFNAFTYK
jgi:hypothetical protein